MIMYSEQTITKLHRLCKQNSELEEVFQQIDNEYRFALSQITHEIRNPLTLINSTVQLIESKNPELAETPLWEQLTDDISDLIILLEDVSVYNHSKSINAVENDLFSLIENILLRFQAFTSGSDIQIELQSTNEVQNVFRSYVCDEVKIRQAFTNILKNAVEAIEDKGQIIISLDANVTNDDDSCKYISISFKNNGKPIEKGEEHNIFKPFVTYKPNGTGMGLAITEKIILAHEGFIRCKLDNSWTEFIVFLPM